MREGVAGLLRKKTRKPGLPPLPPALVNVVALTLTEPPGEPTHWTGRAMAMATGVSLRSVQRIWAAHRLQPHRVRRFKLSQDPTFSAKLRAVVGLYLDPPAHSLVLSVDEKSQIQALDRTQPALPVKNGRARMITHDSVKHGATTLFAALNVLDGTVIGQCMARHRHQEFIRFLNRIEAAVPSRQTRPCHPRQLGRPQASRSARLARPPPALDISRDQPVPRRAQPQTQTLRLDCRSRESPVASPELSLLMYPLLPRLGTAKSTTGARQTFLWRMFWSSIDRLLPHPIGHSRVEDDPVWELRPQSPNEIHQSGFLCHAACGT